MSALDRFFRFRAPVFGSLLNGLFWTGLGAAFLGRNLGVWKWDVTPGEIFWPLFLVWLGVQFISKTSDTIGFKIGDSKGNHNKHYHNTIGELKLENPWTLTKNTYTMWVGDIFIDVTKAFMPDKDSYLELKALAGEVTILVPNELAVEANVDILAGDVKILGQHESGVFRRAHYKSPNWDEAPKRLTLYIKMKAGDITVRDV